MSGHLARPRLLNYIDEIRYPLVICEGSSPRPAQASHGRYEALRALSAGQLTCTQAGERFGHTRSAMVNLVRGYRARPLFAVAVAAFGPARSLRGAEGGIPESAAEGTATSLDCRGGAGEYSRKVQQRARI